MSTRKKKLNTSLTLLQIDSPKIQVLTAKILELKKTLFRDAVETVIEIGEYLIEAKQSLSHGDWLKWLAEGVHFSIRTAQNYISLARLNRANTQLIAYLKDVGVAKLYKLAALPPPVRRKFSLRKKFSIPGRAYKKQIFEMSDIEFYQVVKCQVRPKPVRVNPDLQARRIVKLVSRTVPLVRDVARHADKLSRKQRTMLAEGFKLLAREVDRLEL